MPQWASDFIIGTGSNVCGSLIVLAFGAAAVALLIRMRNFVIALARRWLEAKYFNGIATILLSQFALYRLYIVGNSHDSGYAHFFSVMHFFVGMLLTYDFAKNRVVLDKKTVTYTANEISLWAKFGNWQSEPGSMGLKLIHHDQLRNFLVCKDINDFSDGVIECEVFLETNAIIDVVLRGNIEGSIERDQFYMARLDTRDYYDCILFKPVGKLWSECNAPEELKRRGFVSPSKQWINLKVMAKGRSIHLYRDGVWVDSWDHVQTLSEQIAIFAESADVYVRKITITPYNNRSLSLNARSVLRRLIHES
jgi:hypothetical protein